MSNHENIKHKIISFYFNSTRKHCNTDLKKLSELLDDILSIIKISLYECDDIVEIDIYISYFILLYKLNHLVGKSPTLFRKLLFVEKGYSIVK